MNLTTVKTFRHEVYQRFRQAKDALFNVLDALASEDRAQSLPELSLSPHFQRKWPSVYEALEDGRIEGHELQKAFVKHLPTRSPFPLIAVDGSSIARPKARTSADRSAQHVHNLPESAKPIIYSWQFSTVVALPEKPSGWTYTLDQCRVETTTTAIQVAYQPFVTLAHQGSVAYREEFDLLYRREATHANAMWQADHTPLDVMLLDEEGKPAKPYLTAIEDDFSRLMVGYRLSFQTATAFTTALTLRQPGYLAQRRPPLVSVWDSWRLLHRPRLRFHE